MATHKATIVDVNPSDIDFSNFNPRGEKPADIQEDESFERLKDSVYQYGILVPVVVHRQSRKGKKPYRLVDGERRVRAALATGTDPIPARIAETKRPLDDIVQAFHIHMLRKQWDQVAMARGLRKIIATLPQPTNAKQYAKFFDKLQTLTGCKDGDLVGLLRAVRYSDKVLKQVEQGKIKWSYLIQIEASLVEQVEQHYPEILKSISKDAIRKSLLGKARNRVLSGTRALMLNVAPVISRAETPHQKEAVRDLLRQFIKQADMPAEDVLKEFERKFPDAQADVVELADKILGQAEALSASLSALKAGELSSFPAKAKDVHTSLTALRRIISTKVPVLARISP